MNEYSDTYADVVAESTAINGTPFRVVLHHDPDVESPRAWGNAGVMHLVDQAHYIVPQESDISDLDDMIESRDFRVVARYLRLFHGATVVLPLYSAGGRDLVISAGSATDNPGYDYIGVTYDTPDTRHASFGADAGTDVITAALISDVEIYRQWAEGEVYGLVVQTTERDDIDNVHEWKDYDHDGSSLWGLIGREWAEQSAREALDEVIADHDDTVAQGRAEDGELQATELGMPAL